MTLPVTYEELQHLQAFCHQWLREPGTSHASRKTIPAGGALSHPIELEISELLTFDNVLIKSAIDAKTGTCYTKLIGRQGEPGGFVDTPLDRIYSKPTLVDPEQPAAMRPTQQRYQTAMKRLSETQPGHADEGVPSTVETNAWWIEPENLESDRQPKYLLYTNQQLLGYSLLERVRSGGQMSGRFHASEDYVDYAHIFEALPEAENECFEANVREAYEISDEKSGEYRTRLRELTAQVAELKLSVTDEAGRRLVTSEVRLEDLSRHYNDQSERWLYVTHAES
jgi:hypothetical protein